MNADIVEYHEAGHVVVCCVQGFPVAQVTVDGTQAGSLDATCRGRRLARYQSFVRVCLGGLVAERIAFPRKEAQGSSQDLADARAVLTQLHGNESLVKVWLNKHYLETLGLLTVASHWHAVEILADALFEKKSLTGEEVQALIADKGNRISDEELSDLQDRLLNIRDKLCQETLM